MSSSPATPRRPASHRRLKSPFCACALASAALLAVTPALAERSSSKLRHWDLSHSEWPEQPTAERVIAVRDLQKLFKHYRNNPCKIEIRYPGGREGRSWANEVRGWLVSLGIPIDDISLSIGAEREDALRLAAFPKP